MNQLLLSHSNERRQRQGAAELLSLSSRRQRQWSCSAGGSLSHNSTQGPIFYPSLPRRV